MAHEFAATVKLAQPRSIAAVRVRLPIRDVPRRFADFLSDNPATRRTDIFYLLKEDAAS
jgi:hypothetical protein